MRHAVPPVSTLLPPLRHTLLSICNTASRAVSPPTEKLFSMRCPAPSLPYTHNKKRGAVFRTPVSNPPVLPAAYAYLRLASGIASGALVSCFTFSVTGL